MGCELGNLCWFYWWEIWLVGNWVKWKIHSVQVTLRANCKLRVSCPGPLLRLACFGGGGPARLPPTWPGAVGVAEGRPRGGCHPLLRGTSEVRRSPSPDCPPTGRAAGVHYPLALGASVWLWGPNTVPLACTPCGSCVPRGGWGAVPLPGLGLCAPRWVGPWRSCAEGRAGGGGGTRAPCPPFVRPGGACRAGGRSASFRPSAFPGQATKRSSLASLWSWGGVVPDTTPFCARPPSLGAICAASWRVGRRSLVPRGSCRSRRLGRGAGRAPAPLSGGGRGDHPPCLGGWRLGPLRLAGRWAGWGGGSPRGLPAPPLGGGPRFPTLAPLFLWAQSPPACAFDRGRRAAPGGRG